MPEKIETHPMQMHPRRPGVEARIPTVVSLRAYEVYSEIYRPQLAMVTGACRGGFSAGELITYLYARSFPKDEWERRVDEAFNGMVTS
jgi:hypothetical protein